MTRNLVNLNNTINLLRKQLQKNNIHVTPSIAEEANSHIQDEI